MTLEKDRRPYITVTNELFRHPKWRRIGDKSKLYLLELWGYCNEFRTDGFVERTILYERGTKLANELLKEWVEKTADPDIFYMHDYLAHQPSKAEIEERIKEKREAGATGGKRSAHKKWHVDRGIKNPECDLCQDETG